MSRRWASADTIASPATAAIRADRGTPAAGGESLAGRLEAARIVFFDMDGVILDANKVKVSAMAHALAEFGRDQVDAFITTFKRRFGEPRKAHFERFHREHLDGAGSFDAFYDRYGTRYAETVEANYATAPLTRGAGQLIRTLGASRPLHVITGGDPVQAGRALDNHGLADSFAGVNGAPVSKREHMDRLLDAGAYSPGQAILFGDAQADLKAAAAVGVPFVFVEAYSLIDRAEIERTIDNDAGIPVWSARTLASEDLAAAVPLIGGER